MIQLEHVFISLQYVTTGHTTHTQYVWRVCVCILNICWRYAVAEKPVFNGPCEYTPHTKGNSLQGSFYQTVRPSTVCSVPKIPRLILRVNIQNTVQYCTITVCLTITMYMYIYGAFSLTCRIFVIGFTSTPLLAKIGKDFTWHTERRKTKRGKRVVERIYILILSSFHALLLYFSLEAYIITCVIEAI